MNKALAISLLVICNLAAVFALSVVNLYVLWHTVNLTVTVLIGLAAVTALGFASSRLFSVFERKYSLKARWFIVAAYVPSVIGAAFYYGVESFFAMFLSITAVAYLISGAAWVSTVKYIESRE